MSADFLHLQLTVARQSLTVAVQEQLPLSGVCAIFGPSGGGKSTLLRSIAGFDTPTTGQIQFADKLWFDQAQNINLPPHQRPVGYMFQDGRLFEHRSVAGNLTLAQQFSKQRTDSRSAGFDYDHIVESLDLAPLLQRKSATLSGGEQRRVALARTLLARPALLLLDEPLTGLDADRKADILPYLERALREFELPTLFVSHDINEVAHLADRVLVLDQGKVQLNGPTAQVIERLDLPGVADRFEAGVLIEGTVSEHDQQRHLSLLKLGSQQLSMPIVASLAIGQSIRLRIRARDVAIATIKPEGLSIRNVLAGQLLQLTPEPQPGFVDALVQVGDARIRARLTLAAVEELALKPGADIYVLIKTVSFEGQS